MIYYLKNYYNKKKLKKKPSKTLLKNFMKVNYNI